MIYLWVNDELQFDKYHTKDDRLFQVMAHQQTDKGIQTSGQVPCFTSEALASEMPEVEFGAITTPPAFFPSFTISIPGNNVKATGKFASKDFFNLFSYGLTEGNENNVLSDKNGIVISERLARNLFNTTENISGKSVEYQLFDIKKPVVISGVFKDVPANSSEQFDFVLPFTSFEDIMNLRTAPINWDAGSPFYSYVVLKEGANADEFNGKLGRFIKSKSETSPLTLFVRPFSDNYLFDKYDNGVQAGGRIRYVELFSLIAGFVLVIACINFMNLSTAKASQRIKEVGIKKAIGASRKTLIHHYLGESLLMAALSLILGLTMVQLLLPQFNDITGKQLHLAFDSRLVVITLAITIVTGIVSGSYPALYLSGFSPVTILKGKLNIPIGELWARKGLVMFQFMISVIFIVAVLVVYKQMEFIQNKNLGYNKDNLVYFETDGKIVTNVETFLSEIKKLPGIVNASSMLGNVVSSEGGSGMPGTMTYEGKSVVMNSAAVNYGLLETIGVEMKEGRTFSRDHSSESVQWIFNEAAIEALGIEDAVGKKISGTRGEIVGIVKDFHFQSLHEKVQPFMFRLEPEAAITIMVRIKAGMEKETIGSLQKFYKTFNPGFAFDYKFLDQAYQAQYVAEQRVASLSKYFAGLTVLISCLGLFGLAAFTVERRIKEIGIRKVLGSSEIGIMWLLSGDFARIVFTAVVIALPVSYFAAESWLDRFAYRVDLELWYFLVAGVVALAITIVTVGLQTVRAARINPAQCLKDE
jgi:ABC-type antimicrobial peptide transport system permease subunit